MKLDLGRFSASLSRATLNSMNVSLQAFELWENLNARIASELKVSPEVSVRSYAGLAAAVFEMAQGSAQFYSHKRSIGLIPGLTPYFLPLLPYFYKEGYEVQIAPAEMPLSEWVANLKKDTCFVLACEDHAITGELVDLTEAEKSLNEKKIFCIRVSHSNHFHRAIEIQPYSARICAYNPRAAVAFIGARFRSPPLVAPAMDWDGPQFIDQILKARQSNPENQALVEKFEKNLPAGFSAFLQTSSRLHDRALIYSQDAAGEAIQQYLATALNLQLQRPGWETRIETTHTCRWGGIKNYSDWWSSRPAESILRGLLILGTEVLEHPEMRVSLEKALRECQIADVS